QKAKQPRRERTDKHSNPRRNAKPHRQQRRHITPQSYKRGKTKIDDADITSGKIKRNGLCAQQRRANLPTHQIFAIERWNQRQHGKDCKDCHANPRKPHEIPNPCKEGRNARGYGDVLFRCFHYCSQIPLTPLPNNPDGLNNRINTMMTIGTTSCHASPTKYVVKVCKSATIKPPIMAPPTFPKPARIKTYHDTYNALMPVVGYAGNMNKSVPPANAASAQVSATVNR